MRKINLLMLLTAFALLSSGCDVQVPGNGGGDDGPTDMNTNGEDANSNGEVDGGADDSFAKIQDPDSDFETNEVRDVDGEIMQFDTVTEELVWQLDGTRIADWRVEGTSLIFGNSTFQARFGIENGERRAFFTEVAPPTICNLVVNNGTLSIFSTNTPVPQE